MDRPCTQARVWLPTPMRAFLPFRRGLAASLRCGLPVCMQFLLVSAVASAQSSAENSQPSSAAAAAAPAQTKSDAPATPATTGQDPAKPQHLAAPLGPPSDLVNRQALEQ